MSKIEMIENYLATNINYLDLIIDQVLFLVPDSYFYTPEINQGEFLKMREQMFALSRKRNFSAYRSDANLQRTYKKLYAKYNGQLNQLAVLKRQSLKDELLQETDEMKCACLISLIKQYDLLKRLRLFR